MKKRIKAIASAILPDFIFQSIQAVRSRRYQVRLLKRTGLLEVAERYVERNGCTVKYGPFAGTIYPLKAALSRLSIPKLLGVYEQELHEVINLIGQRKYDVVLDIGSAEGYYAVGLARLLQTKVLAYDPEPIERAYCAAAATLNGVSSLVEMRNLFRTSDIELFRGQRVLCICDCEGFEAEIFDAKTVGDVRTWDLIIELHGGAAAKLKNLAWPHKVTTIPTEDRSGNYREIEGLGDQAVLLSELRSTPQAWLWCDSAA